MILSEKIKIKIGSPKQAKYYQKSGLKAELNDEIFVDASLLPKGSHLNVEVACDICGDKKLIWNGIDKNFVGFGYTRSQFWFRFSINNITGTPLNYLLELDFAQLESIELYIPEGTEKFKIKRTGAKFPFSTRDIEDHNYIFRISQDAEIVTYYIRVHSLTSTNFNLNMMSLQGYQNKVKSELPVYWFYYGLMMVMIIYNL